MTYFTVAGLQLVLKGCDNLDVIRREVSGLVGPAFRPFGRLVTVGLVVEYLEFIEVDVASLSAEEISLLPRCAAAYDQEPRFPKPIDALGYVGESHRIVDAFHLALGRERLSIRLLAPPGKRLGRHAGLAQIGKLPHDSH